MPSETKNEVKAKRVNINTYEEGENPLNSVQTAPFITEIGELAQPQYNCQTINMLSVDTSVKQLQNFQGTHLPFAKLSKLDTISVPNSPTTIEQEHNGMSPNLFYPIYSQPQQQQQLNHPPQKPQSSDQDQMYQQLFYQGVSNQLQTTTTPTPTPATAPYYGYYYHCQPQHQTSLSNQLPPLQQVVMASGDDTVNYQNSNSNSNNNNNIHSPPHPLNNLQYQLPQLIDLPPPVSLELPALTNSFNNFRGFNQHDKKSNFNNGKPLNEAPFNCPYFDCKYRGTFQNVDYLRRHIKEQHITSNDHKCAGPNWGCGKVFKRPYQLVNHWRGRRSLLNCEVPQDILDKYQIKKDMEVLSKKLTRKRRKIGFSIK